MKRYIISTLCIIILASTTLLTACASPTEEEPTADNASIVATAIEQTMQAQVTLPTPTTDLTVTFTPDAMAVPTVAIVSTPITVPTTMTSPNCLVAGLVSETIPDNSYMKKGQKFTKTWKIINGGTCPWSTTYKFVFIDGNSMGAPLEVNLPVSVNPGMITDVSIDMTAPSTDATYTGNWMLKTNTGTDIGAFTVKIIVGTPTATPIPPYAVTSVTSIVVDQNPAACHVDYNFELYITSTGAGDVTYWVEDSIVGVGATNTLNFGSKGTVTTAHAMTINADGDYWFKVYIDKPNHQYFGPWNFHVNCP